MTWRWSMVLGLVMVSSVHMLPVKEDNQEVAEILNDLFRESKDLDTNEVEDTEETQVDEAAVSADPEEVSKYNTYMDAVYKRMNAALIAKLMDPMELNLSHSKDKDHNRNASESPRKKGKKNEVSRQTRDVDDEEENEDAMKQETEREARKKNAKKVKGGKKKNENKGAKKKNKKDKKSKEERVKEKLQKKKEKEEKKELKEQRKAEKIAKRQNKKKKDKQRTTRDVEDEEEPSEVEVVDKEVDSEAVVEVENVDKKEKKKNAKKQNNADKKNKGKRKKKNKKNKNKKNQNKDDATENLKKEHKGRKNQKAQKKNRKNQRESKSMKGRQVNSKVRGTLSGIATMRRTADVVVTKDEGFDVVKSEFSVGPLQLEVSKSMTKENQERSLRTAKATTDIMKGEMIVHVKPDGSATVQKVGFKKPENVDVEGSVSDKAERAESFLKRSFYKSKGMAAHKILKTAQKILNTPDE